MDIAFIDTETTGLDSNISEVIEFAAIRVSPDGSVRRFHTLIRMERIEDADVKALEINGYAKSHAQWLQAPKMSEVGNSIVDFLDGAIICGHNISFDEAMLNANLRRAGIQRTVPYRKIDTVTLAIEHLSPLGLSRFSLDGIRDFLDWDKRRAHTAMKDAEDAWRLFKLTFRMNWWTRVKIRALRFWMSLAY